MYIILYALFIAKLKDSSFGERPTEKCIKLSVHQIKPEPLDRLMSRKFLSVIARDPHPPAHTWLLSIYGPFDPSPLALRVCDVNNFTTVPPSWS